MEPLEHRQAHTAEVPSMERPAVGALLVFHKDKAFLSFLTGTHCEAKAG
jgi:hypothetical protein